MSDVGQSVPPWRPFPSSQITAQKPTHGATKPDSAGFQSFLDAATAQQRQTWNISQHAQVRLQERGIQLTAGDLAAMDRSATAAESKGAKNAYMILPNAGFIVNLPSRTIVTAMDHQANTVVTQIDSVVIV